MGTLLAEGATSPRPAPVPVWAVGSHDTASAVVGVPGRDRALRVHLVRHLVAGRARADQPVLTEDSRRANFTNELGVDGTIRYLRNVWACGCCRSRCARGTTRRCRALAALLRGGGRRAGPEPVIDPDDPEFLPPGDMPARIADACRRRPGSRCPPIRPRRSGASWTAWPGLPARRAAGAGAGRPAGGRRAHGRGRRPQRPAVPAHRRRLRPAGRGGAGRGRGPGQRPGPGARRRAVPAELAGMRDLLRRDAADPPLRTQRFLHHVGRRRTAVGADG